MMSRCVRFLLFSLCILSWLSVPLAGAEELPGSVPGLHDKKILVLHSYSIDYGWTKGLNRGILSVLDKLDWTNVIRFEFLDTKNADSDEYYQDLARLLSGKYRHVHFDGIISTDNNALAFLEQFGSVIFPRVPVVATGINDAGEVNDSPVAVSIIAEQAEHLKTLAQAIGLKPDAKNCYVISDGSTTGRAIQSEVKKQLPNLSTDVRFQFVDKLSLEQLKTFTASIDKNDFIYLLPFFKDAKGITYDQGHVATTLSGSASVPVFVSWDFQLNTGVVGGSVVSGEKYGELAANLMLSIIAGRSVPRIVYHNNDLSVSLYDWSVLERFNLTNGQLPDDAVYINRPVTFYQKHRAAILPACVVIVILSLFSLLLLQNLRNQKVINRHNHEIISLNEEVIETQRELVTTLGEVIETRSRETGNHVKRVAKISRLIGEKVGLSPQEVDILEAASPLHDVGKIGISEAILSYPGKLGEEAFAVMQEHTTIGRDLLKSSDRELLSAACIIAYQHHERWDGTGYPKGLRGEEINIFARITMLADIYDALSMDRCYKKAWPEEKVLEYIRREKGHFFDPALIDVFLMHFEEIRSIRAAYETVEGC